MSPADNAASTPTNARTQILSHRYGKSRVRLMRVTRHSSHHDLDDWTVNLLLTGEFTEAFTEGENTRLLATDTMKNMVYVVANKSSATSLERFAMELIDFILERNPQVTSVETTMQSHLWRRLHVDGQPFPTAFMKGSDERQTATVSRAQDGGFQVRSGFEGMTVLKTAHSSFSGFLRDELTTLQETEDRLLGTAITAEWTSATTAEATDADFHRTRDAVRTLFTEAFARHHSRSVQETLFAMADAVLSQLPEVQRIFVRMPNRHALLIDLSRFGLDNPNHIFVPTEEPHGTIEATLERAGPL